MRYIVTPLEDMDEAVDSIPDTTTLNDRRTVEKYDRCGYGHTQDRPCPASGQNCRKCQKIGHFARVCRKKGLHEVTKVSPTASTSAAQFWLDSIITDSLQPWIVKLKMCGQNVHFKIDTGADVSVTYAKAYEG